MYTYNSFNSIALHWADWVSVRAGVRLTINPNLNPARYN